jgi:uncharacterized membrane protein YphA (DoxX/SURF4 family)
MTTVLLRQFEQASWGKRIRWVLALLVGLYLMQLFVTNGWRKFDADGFWSAPFERWGYPSWFRILVGLIETGAGIGLMIPWVATYSGISLFIVMVGALYTRWGSEFPSDLVWIAVWGTACLWIAFEWRSFLPFKRRLGD